jgi:hypothetical protein
VKVLQRWFDGDGQDGDIIPQWAMDEIQRRIKAGWPDYESDGVILTADVLDVVYPKAEFLRDQAARDRSDQPR